LAASLNPSRNNGDCPDRRTVCVFKLQREAGKAEAHIRQSLQIRQVLDDEDVFSCILENAWLYCGLSGILAKQPWIIRENKKEGIRYGAETLFKSE